MTARPLPNVRRARAMVRRAAGAPYLAEVGDDTGKIYASGNKGYIWVREILNIDPDSGGITRGQAYEVRATGNFIPAYGARVRVRYDEFDGEWEIDRMDFNGMVENGLNPAILNPSNPYNKQLSTLSFPPLRTYAVSDGENPTTEVSIKNFRYLDFLGRLHNFKLNNANRPDIADYEPAAGLKRLIHLWLMPDETIEVSISTPKSVGIEFDPVVDLLECLENRPNNLALPIGAWIMENGDTSIGENDFYADTRQFFNLPETHGMPDPIDRAYVIPDGVKTLHYGPLKIEKPLKIEPAGQLCILDVDATQITRNGASFGDINTGSYSHFREDGTLEFSGGATTFEDLFISLLDANLPAANAPTLVDFLGGPLKQYTFDINDFLPLAAQEIQHAYKPGSSIEIHAHIVTNGTDTTERRVKYRVVYAIANINAQFPTPITVSDELIIPANTPANTNLYRTLGYITDSTINIGACLVSGIGRIASGGTEPTNDPFVLMLGFHIEQNSTGSFTDQVEGAPDGDFSHAK